MSRCSHCGKNLGLLPYTCRYCGKSFCVNHQLPENHDCKDLEKWKRGELKKLKKKVTSRHLTFDDISRSPLSYVPKWLDELMRKRDKKDITIFVLIGVIIVLILAYFRIFK